jgi:uncharacterized membrane protein YccC
MTALLAALLIGALVAFVLWALSGPFRARAAAARPGDSDARRALESAKESKYAEIRDNETDYRTGKLSDVDELDRQLRAEAVEILRAIDEFDAANPAPSD